MKPVGPCLLGFTLLVTPLGLEASPAPLPERPNVLFIAVDDLNDWTGVLGGHPQVQTPHLDRLARRGVTFTRAYTAAPACNPSRVALLTGIRPSTSEIYHNPQPWRPILPDVVTLPQHFMAHGYQVAGAGKIFHGRYPDPASWHEYLERGQDPRPSPGVLQDPRSRAAGIVWGALDVPDSEMDDYRITSWAIEFLKRRHTKAFFLACGLYRPHMPWQVPRRYYDLYPLEESFFPRSRRTTWRTSPLPASRWPAPRGTMPPC